jgi:hypothetical protein
MADRVTVDVKGLKEFNRSLKSLDSDLPKATRIALNGCSDFLIAKTRPQIPRRSGRAANSLKAKSTRTSVRIGVGGRTAPYYPWLDFGGRVGRGRSVARPFYSEGRYLYPTLRRNRDEFTKIMQGAILEVARGAGLEVH